MGVAHTGTGAHGLFTTETLPGDQSLFAWNILF